MICPWERASHELPTGIERHTNAIEPKEVALQAALARCALRAPSFMTRSYAMMRQGTLAKGVTGQRRLANKGRKK
jgi:hypothetical protein